MGTNYYLHRNICTHCGRGDEPLHIGKASFGWCFGLHVDPDRGITDLVDWQRLWAEPGVVIKDEYGETVSATDMHRIITDRASDLDAPMPPQWYSANSAEPGPRGLARHRIDVRHCIGHGSGTWDLIVGEFS